MYVCMYVCMYQMALKKWNIPLQENRTAFSDVWFLPPFFDQDDPTSCIPVTFQQDFGNTFCTW